MNTDANRIGVIATACGALLPISLFLVWWGPPGAFTDPPSGLPSEIQFMAESYQSLGGSEIALDAFEFFEFRDIAWLATGIAGFLFGLAVLTGFRHTAPFAVAVGVLAMLSVISISLLLISPPDLLQASVDRGAIPLDVEFDLPLSREPGGFIALAASCGLVGASVLALRGRRTA